MKTCALSFLVGLVPVLAQNTVISGTALTETSTPPKSSHSSSGESIALVSYAAYQNGALTATSTSIMVVPATLGSADVSGISVASQIPLTTDTLPASSASLNITISKVKAEPTAASHTTLGVESPAGALATTSALAGSGSGSDSGGSGLFTDAGIPSGALEMTMGPSSTVVFGSAAIISGVEASDSAISANTGSRMKVTYGLIFPSLLLCFLNAL